MKVKVILLSVFVLLICSGCSVEYNLDIDKGLKLNESVTIETFNNEEKMKIKDYNSYLPIDINADDYSVYQEKKDGVEYYNFTKDNNKIMFDYLYDVDKFNNNVFARTCYEYVTVMENYNKEEERNELILSTSKEFLCFKYYDSLENVVVKIKTTRDVYSNNADNVEGNTYIWNINKANKEDATINLVIDGNVTVEKLSFWERNLLFLISVGVFILGGVIYLVMKKRSEKVDKI